MYIFAENTRISRFVTHYPRWNSTVECNIMWLGETARHENCTIATISIARAKLVIMKRTANETRKLASLEVSRTILHRPCLWIRCSLKYKLDFCFNKNRKVTCNYTIYNEQIGRLQRSLYILEKPWIVTTFFTPSKT